MTAAGMIAEVQPDAQIIAILREPASFLRSLHMQFVESYIETESDFAPRSSSKPNAARAGTSPRTPTGRSRSSTPSTCATWSSCAATTTCSRREQVLVLVYDDFRNDNEATVRRVLQFLEVDDALPVEGIEANTSVAPRSRRLHHLVHAVSVGRGPSRARPRRRCRP